MIFMKDGSNIKIKRAPFGFCIFSNVSEKKYVFNRPSSGWIILNNGNRNAFEMVLVNKVKKKTGKPCKKCIVVQKRKEGREDI